MCVVPLRWQEERHVSIRQLPFVACVAGAPPSCPIDLWASSRGSLGQQPPTRELVATNSFLPLRRSISSRGTRPGSSWMYLTGRQYRGAVQAGSTVHAGKLRPSRQHWASNPTLAAQPAVAVPAVPGSRCPPHFSGLAATSRLMLPSRWHRSTAPRTSLHPAMVVYVCVQGSPGWAGINPSMHQTLAWQQASPGPLPPLPAPHYGALLGCQTAPVDVCICLAGWKVRAPLVLHLNQLQRAGNAGGEGPTHCPQRPHTQHHTAPASRPSNHPPHCAMCTLRTPCVICMLSLSACLHEEVGLRQAEQGVDERKVGLIKLLPLVCRQAGRQGRQAGQAGRAGR